MTPITKQVLAKMDVCQIINMIEEYQFDIGEKKVRSLMMLVLQIEKTSLNQNEDDVVMVKKNFQSNVLKRLKADGFRKISPIDMELVMFSEATLIQIVEGDNIDAYAFEENIVEWIYLKICLDNELKIWRGFSESMSSEISVLVKSEGIFKVLQRAVYLNPYGHPNGSLEYTTALSYQKFIMDTIEILMAGEIQERNVDFVTRVVMDSIFVRNNFFDFLYETFVDVCYMTRFKTISYCPFCCDDSSHGGIADLLN